MTYSDLFISYPGTARKHAEDLKAELRKNGLTVWMDTERIEPGTYWREAISQAVQECKAVVFLVTPDWAKYGHLQMEWQAALAASWKDPNKLLIPVLLGRGELPAFLRNRVAFKYDGTGGTWERVAKGIVRTIKRGASDYANRPSGPQRMERLRRFAELDRVVSELEPSRKDLEALLAEARATVLSLPADHPDLPDQKLRLALLLKELRQYPEASSVLEEIVQSGGEDPSGFVIPALMNLADISRHERKYEHARGYLVRALRLAENRMGPDSAGVAKLLFELAHVAKEADDRPFAKSLYQKAADLNERIFGPGHPTVADALIELALLAHMESDSVVARTLFTKALTTYLEVYGPLHSSVIRGLARFSAVALDSGDVSVAASMGWRAFELGQKLYPADDHRLDEIAALLFQILRSGDQISEAQRLLAARMARANVRPPTVFSGGKHG